MVDRFERFSLAISQISYYWHKIAGEAMTEYGLKGPASIYLTTMYRFKEGITATELSEICLRDKADVSRTVSLLQKKGFVRKSNEKGVYKSLYHLTKSGEQIAKQINEKAKLAVELGGRGLEDKDREVLYNSLEIISGNLQKLSKSDLEENMSIKAVLFDLDGTLLPMNQEEFANGYFGALSSALEPYGYNKKELISAVWTATKAMVLNDGSTTNEKAFWKKFSEIYGPKVKDDEPHFDAFYKDGFDIVKQSCGYTEKAKLAVDILKEKGIRIILATNPIFPKTATESRIKWAGLEKEDFEYFTYYENSSHCKPNTEYYKDIMRECDLNPKECLMVGNDVSEDMVSQKIGMDVFLLTDCIINNEGKDISVYKNGNFDDLLEYLKKI